MFSHTTTKLAAPIAGVSVLLFTLSVVAAWLVWDLQERASGPIASSVASVTAAQELEISTREIAHQFNRYLIMLDRKHLEPIPKLKEKTAKALANAEAAAATPEEDALMQRTRHGYEHFFAGYEALLQDPPKTGMYPEIIKLTDNVLTPEVLEPTNEYLEFNKRVLTQASETNQDIAQRLVVGLVAIGVFGSIGGALAGWVIAATLRRNLARTEETLLTTAEELDRASKRGAQLQSMGQPADPLERVSVSVSAVLQRLRDTERDALRAEQLAWVGQMAAGIAHEIRNPLMAIKILVQAAAERPDGPALRTRDFQVLEEEILRLEQIVSGFLDFARPPRPDPHPLDATEAVLHALDGIRPRAELQGVSLTLDSPNRPMVLSADANQLRQVLLNLLINALDAQPQGGSIRVGVRIEQDESKGGTMALTVADAGSGIPQSMANRLFEPFVSTKESGLGLGLSICRRIAEAHGGTLSASNQPEGGAIFTLRLPTGK